MPERTYPTPGHSSTYDTGPFIMKFLKRPKDWAAITYESTFEDGGKDFGLHAITPPQFYELEYDGLTDEDANILDEFWNDHGMHVKFTFIEPRDHPWTGVEGLTVTGCNFVSFDRDHNKVKTIQSRKVVIAKYPV